MAEKKGQQGKPYDDRTRMRVIAFLATNMSIAEIHRKTGVAESTIRSWKKQYLEDNPNALSELRAQKCAGFAAVAFSDMEKAQRIMGRRLDRVESDEDVIDEVIQIVKKAGPEELSKEDKKRIIKMLGDLRFDDAGKLSTVIGVLYDKAALASGEPTVNVSGAVGTRLEDT